MRDFQLIIDVRAEDRQAVRNLAHSILGSYNVTDHEILDLGPVEELD